MSHAGLGFRPGGVHPPDGKLLSADAPLVEVPAPKKILLPLAQHLGKPAKAVVDKGAEVSVGQLLAQADGPISAPIHSPVSGKVIRVIDAPVAGAIRQPCLELMNDGLDKGAEAFAGRPQLDWAELGSFLERIQEAGVVGMGGAAFPTVVKLRPPREAQVDTLLINGCECEPYLTADDCLMRERPAEVLAGARMMAAAAGVKSVIVGIEDNKLRALEALRFALQERAWSAFERGSGPEISVRVEALRTRYPQGAEKQLIDAVLRRQVPSGKLPFAVGVIVQNVGTAVAALEAVALRRPLIERIITLSGRAITRPGNYRVRLGTLVSEVVAAAGGTTPELAALIAGGPMMGKSLPDTEVPVVKGMSGVLFLAENETAICEESDCIRCGRCVEACPMRLVPCEITAQADVLSWERAVELGVLDCVECGSCQYGCPARRHLVARLRLIKHYWRRMKR